MWTGLSLPLSQGENNYTGGHWHGAVDGERESGKSQIRIYRVVRGSTTIAAGCLKTVFWNYWILIGSEYWHRKYFLRIFLVILVSLDLTYFNIVEDLLNKLRPLQNQNHRHYWVTLLSIIQNDQIRHVLLEFNVYVFINEILTGFTPRRLFRA